MGGTSVLFTGTLTLSTLSTAAQHNFCRAAFGRTDRHREGIFSSAETLNKEREALWSRLAGEQYCTLGVNVGGEQHIPPFLKR